MSSLDLLNGRRRLGRRSFLRGTAAAALAAPALIGRAKADGVVLNFATYGGVIADYLTKLFAVPFEKQTGIRVNIGGNASLALAKLQTTSGTAAQWDLINLTGAEYLAAIDENIVVPYDYSIVDASYIPPEFKGTHGIKFALFLFGMAYDKRRLTDDKAPRNWAEFWDTQRFPGKRSLYSSPSDGSILEIALLADGVPIDKLIEARRLEDELEAFDTQRQPVLGEQEREHLMRLGADLEIAWSHPAATAPSCMKSSCASKMTGLRWSCIGKAVTTRHCKSRRTRPAKAAGRSKRTAGALTRGSIGTIPETAETENTRSYQLDSNQD